MGETKRTTVSLPKDKYEQLQEELDTFSSDTARFQHLVELFLSDRLGGSNSTHPSDTEGASCGADQGTSETPSDPSHGADESG